MKAVTEFAVDLAGVVVVEASEGEAVVGQDAPVGDIGGGDGSGGVLAKAFTDGEVDAGVVGQVAIWVRRAWVGAAVGETGAVVDVGGDCGAEGKGGVEADVEGVALIVINRGIVEARVTGGVADRGADKTASNIAALCSDLVGVGEVGLPEVPETR